MKTICFGVEVLQSTRRTFDIDKEEENNLWRESMQIEIDQLHAHETFGIRGTPACTIWIQKNSIPLHI